MSVTPAALFARLRELGIATQTSEHPALFTVEQSRALRGEIAGAHSKNLFLKDKKGRIFLLVAQEDSAIDLKRLHHVLGCGRLSFAQADLLRACLGVEPGAVTPFGLINDRDRRVSVAIDARLLAHARLNFHPLVNTATTTIDRDGLLRFIRACGHEPRIVDLAAGGPP